MFTGLEWYWWLAIVLVLMISIPFKIRFIRWWKKYRQEQKENSYGKWGDDK